MCGVVSLPMCDLNALLTPSLLYSYVGNVDPSITEAVLQTTFDSPETKVLKVKLFKNKSVRKQQVCWCVTAFIFGTQIRFCRTFSLIYSHCSSDLGFAHPFFSFTRH